MNSESATSPETVDSFLFYIIYNMCITRQLRFMLYFGEMEIKLFSEIIPFLFWASAEMAEGHCQ